MLLPSVSALEQFPTRIVSLVPSQTELLHYLGLEKETVGITRFCVHPPEWKNSKIIIGGTKNIKVDVIKTLRPGLIIANKEENLKSEVEELAVDFPVWLTDINNLEDALHMIGDVGRLTNTVEKAERLAADISRKFSQLSLNHLIPAAYLIWRNPFMTVGGDTFISDMMAGCGLKNIFARKKRYPEITIGELKEEGCKVLILSTEPYPFKPHHMQELQLLLPGTKICLADGEMFSWYGSRLLEAPGYFQQLINRLI